MKNNIMRLGTIFLTGFLGLGLMLAQPAWAQSGGSDQDKESKACKKLKEKKAELQKKIDAIAAEMAKIAAGDKDNGVPSVEDLVKAASEVDDKGKPTDAAKKALEDLKKRKKEIKDKDKDKTKLEEEMAKLDKEIEKECKEKKDATPVGGKLFLE